MTIHRKITLATLLLTTTALAAPEPAARPATPAAPSGNTTIVLPPIDTKSGATIPPEMIDALRKLADDDFKVREAAVANLQQVMTRQFQQMVALQTLMLRVQDGLAEQLKQMTAGAGEAEGQARVAGLMEFNSALSRWAIDVMALPEKQREELLKWGTKEENLPLLARAYGRSEEVRAKVAREIAKMEGPEADWLIVQLLNDPSREVGLLTMDAIFDRKPTTPIVSALWDRATLAAMNQIRQRQGKNKNINVRGRMINIYEQDYAAQARMQDVDVAVDVLLKYKDPLITERLNDLFTELASTMNNQGDYRWRVISPNYGDGGRALSRLIDAYKPKKSIPFLVKAIAMSNANDGSDTTMGNNEKYRYSSRIDAAAMLIRAIGQDPDEYNVKKHQNWGDRWLIKGGVAEEEAMVKKLQTWWKEHSSEYESTTTKPAEKATTPAVEKAATAPAVQMGPRPLTR
jgi:HEAT repeat protein